MILVVSLNPALDLTYEVQEADWAGVNRPQAVHVRPGGKGVNVARTLRALGREVRLVGLTGGAAGAELAELLAGSGIAVAFTAIAGPTRRTLTVVDAARQQAALFNEPGPIVEATEYRVFLDGYLATLGECEAVVLSGSLPGGVGAEAYAGLITAARGASVPVILDTSGPALALGAAAGPTVVKPNLAELEHATSPESATTGKVRCRSDDLGESSLSLVAAGAEELVRVGAGSVVVSLGAGGLLAVAADGCWWARPGESVNGNATGAGDAVVAGLVDGLVRGLGWPERLRQAVALGTATVAAPVAGEYFPDEYERQRPLVQLTSVSGPR